MDQKLCGCSGIVLDSRLLISLQFEQIRQVTDQIGLSLTLASMVGQGSGKSYGGLTSIGVLLIVQFSRNGVKYTKSLKREDAVTIDIASKLLGGRATLIVGSGSKELSFKLIGHGNLFLRYGIVGASSQSG